MVVLVNNKEKRCLRIEVMLNPDPVDCGRLESGSPSGCGHRLVTRISALSVQSAIRLNHSEIQVLTAEGYHLDPSTVVL